MIIPLPFSDPSALAPFCLPNLSHPREFPWGSPCQHLRLSAHKEESQASHWKCDDEWPVSPENPLSQSSYTQVCNFSAIRKFDICVRLKWGTNIVFEMMNMFDFIFCVWFCSFGLLPITPSADQPRVGLPFFTPSPPVNCQADLQAPKKVIFKFNFYIIIKIYEKNWWNSKNLLVTLWCTYLKTCLKKKYLWFLCTASN